MPVFDSVLTKGDEMSVRTLFRKAKRGGLRPRLDLLAALGVVQGGGGGGEDFEEVGKPDKTKPPYPFLEGIVETKIPD